MKDEKVGSGKIIVLSVFIFFLAFVVAYKYFEWSSFKQISSLANTSDVQELKFVERASKLNNDVSEPLLAYFETSDKLKISEGQEQVSDLKLLVSKIQNNDEEYLAILKTNRENYQRLAWRGKFLVGKQRTYYNEIADIQTRYYDKEIESAKMALASDYLGINFFQTLEDNYSSGQFVETVGDDTDLVSGNLWTLSALSKYLDSNYKFPHFDEIVQYFPYAEQAFTKHREYYGTYYAVMKDYASGNLESASYKYTKLQEMEGSRHVDYDRLFSENDENSKLLKKEIFTLLVSKITKLRDYSSSNLGTYPVLDKISFTTIDLDQCQMYVYKDGLIYSISEKYVSESIQTVDDYLSYLNETPPQTDNINASFDRSAMQIENTKEKLTIKCTSKSDDLKLTFETLKN